MVPKTLKTFLIITGALSALVLMFPGLIIIGMIFFVVPGLILIAMPTLFLYLFATSLIRLALPITNSFIAYPIAATIAVALASLAIWPLRHAAEHEFEVAIQP
jgi:hypothetical protein